MWIFLQVEGARSKYEQGARGVAALEQRREGLRAERSKNADVLPGLERKKRVSGGGGDIYIHCIYIYV